MNNIFVGFDPREAAVYHAFCQSVISTATVPVSFSPLHSPMLNNFDGQGDGTNAFVYSRYLIPYLMDYKGWALFVDGDMIVTEDIDNLFALADESKAVQVVKHDYKTKHPRKYIGTSMESDNVDYPRKNWSSVVLWNCSHPAHRLLTPLFVQEAGGAFLHRFEWLGDNEVGELPAKWNHLVGEQEPEVASLYHYTLGAPGFAHYAGCYASVHWRDALREATNMDNMKWLS